MTLKSLMNLDRRIIFLFIFLAVLIPYLVDFPLPIKANRLVQSIYNKVEKVAEKNGTVLLSIDFDPASAAELEPAFRAMVSHLFMRNVKVVVMGHWNTGIGLGEGLMNELSREYGKEYGKDWAFVGWKSGQGALILVMGYNFKEAYARDTKGNELKKLEVTKNINSLKDFDYVFSFSAGSAGVDMWVAYGQTKFKFPFGAACTAVMAPDFFPYLDSGQLNGLMAGLAGAAQYETLIKKPGAAVVGMKPQSVAHLVLIFFILFGNVCYFINKRREKRSSGF